MSFLNCPFSKKESQRESFDADQFMRALGQFVNADTWDKSQRIVEQYPMLLHPDSDDLLR